MGQSTDGQLSFGVVFEEDAEFPWQEMDDPDVDEWWKHVNDYDNPHYCPWTDEGDYKDDAPVTLDAFGRKSLDHDHPKIKAYYEHIRQWEEKNPLPVQLVNYCSGDYPMYLIAVKHIECSRGYPEEIDPAFLEVSDDERQRLDCFLKLIGMDGEPKWWLTSYWG